VKEEKFTIPADAIDKALSWSTYKKSECMKVDNDLTVTNTTNIVGVIIAADIMPYFEIKVESISISACIAIGYVTNQFKDVNLPGWLSQSWAYHSYDGNIYLENEAKKKFGESWGTGDTIGCGFTISKNKRKIFFTKNGKFIDFAYEVPLNLNIYTAVGMNKKASVGTYFADSYEKFSFDPKHSVKNFHRYQSMKAILLSPTVLIPTKGIATEIWNFIFTRLRDVDWCYYSSVCRYWHQQLNSEKIWQIQYQSEFPEIKKNDSETWKEAYWSRILSLQIFLKPSFCQVAREMHLAGYVETSAKMNCNVEEAFMLGVRRGYVVCK